MRDESMTGQSMGKIRVLFMHNSVPEYRLRFWRLLQEKAELDLLITNQALADRIYGLDTDPTGLPIRYWSKPALRALRHEITGYDAVILPPADTAREWLIGYRMRRLCGKKHVAVLYWTEKWEPAGMAVPVKKKIRNIVHAMMIGVLARNCTRCIASGTKAREYFLRRGINDDRITIAYDSSTSPECTAGIDFQSRYGIPGGSAVILFLGRIVERKGVLPLIKAFPQLRKPDCYLLICGEGEFLDTCVVSAKRLKVGRVVFAGKIQPGERKAFFERAAVLCLPSIPTDGTIESWGLTLNEALECGTPVVATDAVGAAFDLVNEGNGVIVPVGQIARLHEAIEKCLEKTDREAIKNHYLESFSVEKMSDAFYSAIRLAVNATEKTGVKRRLLFTEYLK